MKIAICSMFRDSQVIADGFRIDQIPRYFSNLYQQEKECTDVELKFFLLEGDSSDNTWEVLQRYESDKVHIQKHDIGGSAPSSAGTEERRKTLSKAGNLCLKPAIESGADYILWMESDLLPSEGMLKGLIDSTKLIDWDKTAAIAPLTIIMLQGHQKFYDGYAYEGINGEKWGLHDVQKFKNHHEVMRPMRSIGSCALLNGKILRDNNIDFQDGCFPRLCGMSIEKGFGIYCNILLNIFHPAFTCINSRWV